MSAEIERRKFEYLSMKCLRRATLALRKSLGYFDVLNKIRESTKIRKELIRKTNKFKISKLYVKDLEIDELMDEIIVCNTRLQELLARFEEATNSELEPTTNRVSYDLNKIDFFIDSDAKDKLHWHHEDDEND